MAKDVEQLVLSISADTAQIRRALKRLEGETRTSTRQIESNFNRMGDRVGRVAVGISRSFVAAFAGLASARGLQQLSDAAIRIDNALKVAGLSGEELEGVYSRLRDSAVNNAAPLEALVELYSRAALVQNELGVSGERLVQFTDNIALALRVSGKSAQESSGALLQLSQALGSGVVRAEEFNSLLEGAPTILQAAAAGIREAEGSVAKLRQIMLDGELSSRALFEGVSAGAAILEDKVKDAEFTIGQATGNLRTALLDTVREFNKATNAGERFAGGINNLADAVANFDMAGFIEQISAARSEFESFMDRIGNAEVFQSLNDLLGVTDETGNVINLDASAAEQEAAGLERQVELLQATIEKNSELGFDNAAALAQLDQVLAKLAAVRQSMGAIPPTLPNPSTGDGRSYQVGTPGDPNALAGAAAQAGLAAVGTTLDPISISDFPVTGGSEGSAGSGGRGRKGGGGGAGRRAEEYARLTERIKEATAATQAETAVLASLNPLVDDYGFAVEKARMEHELLTAAQKDGRAVTPQLRAEIEALAEGYAAATAEAARLAEAQDDIRYAAEEMADFNKDLARGIVDGFMQGKDAADIFADALGKIADRLLDMAFDSIFSSLGGGGGILKALGFRANGGPIETNKPYIVGERGPEMIVPNRSGMVIPNNLLGRSAAGGGSQTITLRVIGEEGPMFRPMIEAVSQDVSVKVVRRNNEAMANFKQNGGN